MSVFIGYMKAEPRFSPPDMWSQWECSSWTQPCPRSPTVLQICFLCLPTHPGAPSPFYDCFLPPGFSAAAQRHFQGKQLQVGHIAFFVFHRPSLGGMSWVFHPPRQGKGNLKLAGTDLKTLSAQPIIPFLLETRSPNALLSPPASVSSPSRNSCICK